MKKIILIFLFLISINAYSQPEIASGLGYSNKTSFINIQVGYDFKFKQPNSFWHLYYNQIVHFTSLFSTPDILGLRIAYNKRYEVPIGLEGFEPAIGIDYHLLSSDIANDKYRGWQFGYSLSYKFPKLWFLQIGGTGNIYYGMAGVFKRL